MYNKGMKLGKFAEANHTHWALPYKVGTRLMVRRATKADPATGRLIKTYCALRCVKHEGTWLCVRLGECDARGYPVGATQLQM